MNFRLKTYFLHFKSIKITNIDKVSGLIIYPLGDLIAQLILGDVSILRLFFVALLGRFIYAIEIPKWFGFLATWKKQTATNGFSHIFWEKESETPHLNWLGKTIGATIWFHPIWIARHMLVIELANIIIGKTSFIEFLPEALKLGTISYIGQFPIAVVVNYIIICKLNEETRFIWSSVFSGLLAIYYAIGRAYL